MSKAVFENAQRYKYVQFTNGRGIRYIVCMSHYAGKVVKAVAKCSPNDEYDAEFGKRLARARCDEKIAEKRFRRAADKCAKALLQVTQAQREADKMRDYFKDANSALKEARHITKFLEEEAAN